MRQKWIVDGEESLHGEGHGAVDAPHEADVGQRQQVWQHVHAVHRVEGHAEFRDGEQQDGANHINL